MGEAATVTGPDLSTEGYPAADLGVGDMVLGHIEDTPVVLARSHDGVFAIGARCTHYGASLGAGKLDDNLVFCPLHHSAFDIRSGRAVRAPALNPVPRFSAAERDGTIYVSGPVDGSDEKPDPGGPSSIIVVGAGAAGAAAVETLRNEGYRGPITMFGAEDDVPIDRPNLSKDYLAGSAPEEWMPLRSEGFYADNNIDLRLGTRVIAIDRDRSVVSTDEGSEHAYGALLLATGADPITIPIPGAATNRVFTLRTLADSKAIIEALDGSASAAVIGASFIGLEVAASLRERGIGVHVVAPETVLMEPVLGGDVGRFIRALHESHGVVFHLGHVAGEITPEGVTLDDGSKVAADVIVMGVGVRPAVALAEAAGLVTDNGVLVDEQLRTSDPAIFAGGDIARYPDRRLGARRAPRPGGGAQHAGPRCGLPRRPLLLEPALRRADQLRGPRRIVGLGRDTRLGCRRRRPHRLPRGRQGGGRGNDRA